MKTTKLPPVHPGEILLHDFIEPLRLSAYTVANAIGSTRIATSEIIPMPVASNPAANTPQRTEHQPAVTAVAT